MALSEEILRVLLLEDNPDDASLIIRILSKANISLVAKVVGTKEEYQVALDSFSPELILSDHQLPGFNSEEALSIARKNYPFIPFILVTGTVSEEFAASIIKAGADDYLLKNNLKRLPTAVQQALEKKSNEQKLKSAHERLLFHMDNTPLGFIERDENLNVKSYSKKAIEIFGWSEAELIENDFSGFNQIHDDDIFEMGQAMGQLMSGLIPRNTIQNRSYTKDGSIIWGEWFNSVLKDENGRVVRIMSLVQDITDRRRISENLEKVIARFEQAQLIAHLGHWEVNLKNKKRSWSAETYRIFGLAIDSLEPTEKIFQSFIHPEDIERFNATADNSRDNYSAYSLYHRIVRQDGEIRSVYSAGHYEFDKDGHPQGLYGVLLDITELTEKENELARANKELETFIYKMYHDLRSPILSILGIVDLALKEVKDEKSLEYFSIIDEVTLKQNKMLNALVRVMSIRDRKVVFELIDMNLLLQKILKELEITEGFSLVKFDYQTEIKTPIFIDGELLYSIIFQLIENAILYRNPHAGNSIVNINVSNAETNMLVLQIEDNGMGISPAIEEKVFDMFYRGTNFSKGAGLGLYLVKNAVEKLNGTISLSSIQYKQTTFSIRLPLK